MSEDKNISIRYDLDELSSLLEKEQMKFNVNKYMKDLFGGKMDTKCWNECLLKSKKGRISKL